MKKEKNKSIKINAVLNTAKQCCSILFPMITFPYVSRTLQAMNYGKANFALSFVNYISLIAALGIQTYAIREGAACRKDRKKFEEFSSEIFSINILSTIVAFAVMVVCLFAVPKLNAYRTLILIFSLNIVFTTIGQDWINSVYEDYGYLTLRYLVTNVLSLILILLLVRKKEDVDIYAWLSVFPFIVSNLVNLRYIRKYTRLRFKISKKMKLHMKPILILFANSVTIFLYIYSDSLMLGFLKDDQTVGIYSVASKIYLMVKQLLNAVVVVSIPRFSYYLRNEKIQEYQALLRKTFLALFTLVVPAVAGMFLKSKEIILFISGKEYIAGSNSLQILSFALFFAIMASVITQCVIVPYRKEKSLFKITIFSAALNIILNFILIPVISYNGAAITTLLAEMSTCIFGYLCVREKIKMDHVRKNILISLLGCIAIGVVCLTVDRLVYNVYLNLLLSVGISVGIYGILMLTTKNEIIYPMYESIKKKVTRRSL